MRDDRAEGRNFGGYVRIFNKGGKLRKSLPRGSSKARLFVGPPLAFSPRSFFFGARRAYVSIVYPRGSRPPRSRADRNLLTQISGPPQIVFIGRSRADY